MIRFHYEPTFKEFWALNRYVLFRGYRALLIPFGIILLVVFITSPFVHQPNETKETMEIYRSNLPMLILPGLLVFLTVVQYWSARKRWNGAKQVRAARDYVIDDNGIHVSGDGFAGNMEWAYLKSADFKAGLLFLKSDPNLFYYFPPSIVPNKKTLIDLVSNKVKVSKSWRKA